MSSRQAARALAGGLTAGLAGVSCQIVPLSDGGEGLIDCVLDALGGERRRARVRGPLGAPVDAAWMYVPDRELAVIEMAAASGLPLMPPGPGAALRASTWGTGELLRAALDGGASRIVVGLGGSATTDGGAGCAQALGIKLLNAAGAPIDLGGEGLLALNRIELSSRDRRLDATQIEAMCDVTNPLLGSAGAAAIYGPNKGLDAAGVAICERGLARLAECIGQGVGLDVRHLPSGGAAGGLGAGLTAFCGARLMRGADWVLDVCDFDAALSHADVVITGEGRIDAESIRGKVVGAVSARAARLNIPVVALVGESRLAADQVRALGLAGVFSVVRSGVSPARALDEPERELQRLAHESARAVAGLVAAKAT